AEFVRTVKLMSEVKVVRRKAPGGIRGSTPVEAPAPVNDRIRIVGVGASTGGPVAMQGLLDALPEHFPVPILVVQHIAAGFLDGFLQWLNRSSRNEVRVAVQGETALPGCVYVAPDGLHMGVDRNLRIALSDAPPDAGLRPSVAHLLKAINE